MQFFTLLIGAAPNGEKRLIMAPVSATIRLGDRIGTGKDIYIVEWCATYLTETDSMYPALVYLLGKPEKAMYRLVPINYAEENSNDVDG